MNSVRILRENFFMLQCGKNYWSMYCVPQFSGVRRRREKNLEPQKIDGLSSIIDRFNSLVALFFFGEFSSMST